MRTPAIIAAALLLAACAHNLTLTPRSPGLAAGSGKASASMGNSGKITVDLNGKSYAGRWIYVSGGAVGVGTAYSGASVTTGTVVAMSGSGPGQALLTAPDGSRLRCQFTYSQFSRKGFGECVDDAAGQVYDLTVG